MRLGGTDRHRSATFENNKIEGNKVQTTTLYQKYAMIKLLLDNDVKKIYFKPEKFEIVVPITKDTFDLIEYTPDFLVIIKNKKYIVEIRAKEIVKENIKYFKAAMKEMRKQGYEFELWDYQEEEIIDITELLKEKRKRKKKKTKKKGKRTSE